MSKFYHSISIYTRKDSPYYWVRFQNKCFSSKVKIAKSKREDQRLRKEITQALFAAERQCTDEPATQEITNSILDLWNLYKSRRLVSLKPETQKIYQIAYQRIISKEQESFSKENLYLQVEYFLLNNTQLTQSSKNIYLRNFQSFISWACEYLQISPIINVKKKYSLQVKPKDVMPYEKYEFDRILPLAEHGLMDISRKYWIVKPDKEFCLLLKFMEFTGARIKESLELHWRDIDFKKKLIYFKNKRNKFVIDYFPITDKLIELLHEIKHFHSDSNDLNGKLFRWNTSSKSRLSKRIGKIENILSIKKPGRCFHGIRKMFCTNLIERNLPITDVKNIMRHSDINTTLRHYTKVNQEKNRRQLSSAGF